jgi:malonate transporter MadL subunit
MTIYGVALMAICSLIGVGIGDFLGDILHVKANLGGVGFAMILLLMARAWLQRNKALSSGIVLGTEFWATMYIPIAVALAATQDVASAVSGGPMVLVAGIATFLLCALCVGLFSRFDKHSEKPETEDPILGDGP